MNNYINKELFLCIKPVFKFKKGKLYKGVSAGDDYTHRGIICRIDDMCFLLAKNFNKDIMDSDYCVQEYFIRNPTKLSKLLYV